MPKKILTLLILGSFLLIWACGGGSGSDDDPGSTIKIGALQPLSGDGGPIDGTAVQAAAEAALADMGHKAPGTDINIEIIYKDSQYQLEVMMAAVEELEAEGVRAIVSATTSENLQVVKDTAARAGLPMIDITSTSPRLAIDDNLFRYIPDDTLTSAAISQRMVQQGVKRLAIVYRSDIWGRDLASALQSHFQVQQMKSQRGTVILYAAYDARLPLLDIPTVAAELNDKISAAIAQGAPDETAVALISFEEGVEFLREAAQYPALARVDWYGSDGMGGNKELLTNAEAAGLAAKVGLFCPIVGNSGKPSFTRVQNQIEQEIGYTPFNDALLMYDAVTAAATTLGSLGDGSSMEDFKTRLYQVTEEMDAITGHIRLNAAGDRESCPYDFWRVSVHDGVYNWVNAN